jgi:hypothetical protein
MLTIIEDFSAISYIFLEFIIGIPAPDNTYV